MTDDEAQCYQCTLANGFSRGFAMGDTRDCVISRAIVSDVSGCINSLESFVAFSSSG